MASDMKRPPPPLARLVAPPEAPPEALPGRDALAALGRPILLMAGLVAAGLLLRLMPPADFPHTARLLGLPGFMAVAAALCAVGLPRQLVAFGAGFTHGAWAGALLALAAQCLGCAADFWWARLVARGWVRARMRGRFGPRLTRLDRFLAAHPFKATLTLRLLPVGNNVALNLLAGAFAVPWIRFLAASALGYLPQTAIFALLGSGVHVARGVQLGLGLVLFMLTALFGIVLLMRARGTGAV